MVPSHPLLHAAAAGVPVPSAAIPAVPVLHTAVSAAAGVPVQPAALAVDAAGAGTGTAVVPVPSSAADFLGAVSAPAAATACVPVPELAAVSAPATVCVSTIAVVLFATASSSSAAAAASAAFVPLAFPAVTFLPSDESFCPFSSAFEAFQERSNHLVFF